MFGSQMLEVAIGLALIYLVVSLICSALQEIIAWSLKLRSKVLKEGILRILQDPKHLKDLADQIYADQLIKTLGREGKDPSYIPSRAFASAFMNVLVKQGKTAISDIPLSLQAVNDAISNLPAGSEVKNVLRTLIDETVKDLDQARDKLEKWFNDAMDRVTGWYKRKTQIVIIIVALAVSVGLNIDTLRIADRLVHDSALRESLVVAAQEAVKAAPKEKQQNPSEMINDIAENTEKLETLQIPMGWNEKEMPKEKMDWLSKCIGLLFTVLLVSLGAPFWFDLLNKFVNLRSGGKPPAEQKETGEEKK